MGGLWSHARCCPSAGRGATSPDRQNRGTRPPDWAAIPAARRKRGPRKPRSWQPALVIAHAIRHSGLPFFTRFGLGQHRAGPQQHSCGPFGNRLAESLRRPLHPNHLTSPASGRGRIPAGTNLPARGCPFWPRWRWPRLRWSGPASTRSPRHGRIGRTASTGNLDLAESVMLDRTD